MDGKPTESRVRVWTDFYGGWRRGSGKADAVIITMIFLYMRPDSEAFGFPIQWTKEAGEQSESGKRTNPGSNKSASWGQMKVQRVSNESAPGVN